MFMTRKAISWLMLAALLFVGALAQAQAGIRAPFYEAVRGKQVIYVLGTMHVGRADFYPLRPAIETALKKSSRLFVEANLDEPGVKEQLAQDMLCSQPCLKEALTESEWKTLTERLGKQEAAIRQIERIRPWAAAVVLSMGDFMALGLDADKGVEDYLLKQAGESKPVIGLETPGEQMQLFTAMTAAEQKEMLVQWLNMSVKERLDTSRDLIRHWQAGDADAIYAWNEKVGKQYSSSPELEETFNRKFILERNRAFVARLLPQIRNESGPFFLAIGALHLGGPDGVLGLLKKQGYTVKAK